MADDVDKVKEAKKKGRGSKLRSVTNRVNRRVPSKGGKEERPCCKSMSLEFNHRRGI